MEASDTDDAPASSSGTFDRGLSDDFMAKLAAEARAGGWWSDVLNDPKLVIGLRGKHLNIYWRGQRLFDVSAAKTGLNVTTHEKFLLDPSLAGQVPLVDGIFGLQALLAKGGFIGNYEGRTTLAKMKTMASLFSGEEKEGCHEIAVRNSSVIDCEIALPGYISSTGDKTTKTAPRIDLASLEHQVGSTEVRLVFWEAKRFGNGELRSAGDTPSVVGQIRKYREYLIEHQTTVLASYLQVVKNLHEIGHMGWCRELHPAIAAVAAGECQLTLGIQPKVGLIIFGFDEAQRDHAGWIKHLEVLQGHGLEVLPRGDAKSVRI